MFPSPLVRSYKLFYTGQLSLSAMSVLDTTTTLQSKPDVDSEHKTTAVEWFQPTIKQLNPDVARFFKDYVGLKDTEEILSHIYDIRSQAWQM